ncbi:hypothetical protein JB92DRAFT_2830725 [Gautieria morchelliformis]|nr:hypothetical protein JB92DRAFT_2830725 [Gautieria morchelliformis]
MLLLLALLLITWSMHISLQQQPIIFNTTNVLSLTCLFATPLGHYLTKAKSAPPTPTSFLSSTSLSEATDDHDDFEFLQADLVNLNHYLGTSQITLSQVVALDCARTEHRAIIKFGSDETSAVNTPMEIEEIYEEWKNNIEITMVTPNPDFSIENWPVGVAAGKQLAMMVEKGALMINPLPAAHLIKPRDYRRRLAGAVVEYHMAFSHWKMRILVPPRPLPQSPSKQRIMNAAEATPLFKKWCS